MHEVSQYYPGTPSDDTCASPTNADLVPFVFFWAISVLCEYINMP